MDSDGITKTRTGNDVKAKRETKKRFHLRRKLTPLIHTIYIMGILLVIGSSCTHFDRTQVEEARMKIMTYNTLYGGTRRGQPLSQTAKVIQDAKADVVGLQEVGDNAKALADLLGWNHVRHGWSATLTRYDIVDRYEGGIRDGGIRIRLDSGQEVNIFNLHLRSSPYQPYQLLRIPYDDAPFITTEREAITSAKKTRGGQITTLLNQIQAIPDENVSVIVIGDFNEPSHLDWTKIAAESGRHPIKVAYPSSLAMAEAGFADAWRAAYPDEMNKPGFTWTPLTKPDDPEDHHDRIDFVYFRGKGIALNEVKIVGENKENADIVVSPYPSDHRAVVAAFTVSEREK